METDTIVVLQGNSRGDTKQRTRGGGGVVLGDPVCVVVSTSSDEISADERDACAGPNTPAWQLLKTICRLGAPISLSHLAQFGIMLVMMVVIGHIGVLELGGASVAFGLINATGFAFGSGICGALETVLSQCYGRDPCSKAYGLYTQRMLAILVVAAIPLSIALLYVEPLLLQLGEPESVAHHAGRFCRASAWGVFPIMLLELLRRYYVSQCRPNPTLVALVAMGAVSPFVTLAGVHLWGYEGVAVAYCLTFVLMDAGLIAHLLLSGLYRPTWGGWTWAALRQWGPLLRLAVPTLAMACSEWAAMEVNSVIAGFGSSTELAAYAVSSQVVSICWAVGSGVYMATTVQVGSAIGCGSPDVARRYAILTTYLSIGLAACDVVVVFLFREPIARLFTDDDSVVDTFSRMAPYFLAYHLLDALQCNILGILRGCGEQAIGMVVVFVGLPLVGVPTGIYLFLSHGVGVEALWVGPLVGYLCVSLPAFAYIFYKRLVWHNFKPSIADDAPPEAAEMIVCSEDDAAEVIHVRAHTI